MGGPFLMVERSRAHIIPTRWYVAWVCPFHGRVASGTWIGPRARGRSPGTRGPFTGVGRYLRREEPPLERPPPDRPPLERLEPPDRPPLDRLERLEPLPPELRNPPEARLAPPREEEPRDEKPRDDELLRDEEDDEVPRDDELLRDDEAPREEDDPREELLEERLNPMGRLQEEPPELPVVPSLARAAVLFPDTSRLTLAAREVPPPPWERPWRSRREVEPLAGASDREANPAPPLRSTRGVLVARGAGASERLDSGR
jgi:hypothetical protein